MSRILVFLLLASCSTDSSDLDRDAQTSNDANVNGDSGIEGTFPCGDTMCSSDQLCFYSCCGGVLPPCVEPTDGGTCTMGQCLGPNGPTTGCFEQCAAAAPYCGPVPASCNGNPTCNCVPGCTQGTCGVIQDREVHCVCA